jgi:hypothetical protein
MAYNLKTRIVDTTFDPSTALLFGGDSQASSQPSVYEASKISDALAASSRANTALDDRVRQLEGTIAALKGAV